MINKNNYITKIFINIIWKNVTRVKKLFLNDGKEINNNKDRKEENIMFDYIFDKLILFEGGYVDNPMDRGGKTKYGITQKTLSNYMGIPASKNDVKNLTIEDAKAIYRELYWDKQGIDQYQTPIAILLFDVNVNSGWKNAGKIAQRALKDQGYNLVVDGIVGQKTITALNRCNVRKFIDSFCTRRSMFYFDIIFGDWTQKVFKRGWLSRNIKLHGIAIELYHGKML